MKEMTVHDTIAEYLSDSPYVYKRASIDDMDELVRTRIEVLRAANKLSDEIDMSQVQQEA